jgi:NIMA-interacting peptidyl-prolyl cis-trans isomerase 1
MCIETLNGFMPCRESRRPSSWKEPVITRSKDEALQKIQAFRQQLVSGQADFVALASVESDCSSARRGGDLGKFGPGQMQQPFEEATYALKVACALPSAPIVSCLCEGSLDLYDALVWADDIVHMQVGELSQPVFTDSGVHLILRTA